MPGARRWRDGPRHDELARLPGTQVVVQGKREDAIEDLARSPHELQEPQRIVELPGVLGGHVLGREGAQRGCVLSRDRSALDEIPETAHPAKALRLGKSLGDRAQPLDAQGAEAFDDGGGEAPFLVRGQRLARFTSSPTSCRRRTSASRSGAWASSARAMVCLASATRPCITARAAANRSLGSPSRSSLRRDLGPCRTRSPKRSSHPCLATSRTQAAGSLAARRSLGTPIESGRRRWRRAPGCAGRPASRTASD